MPVRRSKRRLAASKVRRFKRESLRIDRKEADAIRAKGRRVRARHERLRAVVQLLKAERQRLGLSLAEVGERSGIGKSNLSRLENDPTPNPTLNTVLRYAEALGRDIRISLADPTRSGRRRAS